MKNKKNSAVRCNLCGSTRYYLVSHERKRHFATASKNHRISESEFEKLNKVVRCMSCGLVYAYPDENLKSILHAYEGMQSGDGVHEEAGRRAQARMILTTLAKYKKTGLLLDIGGGPGFLLDEARRQGWKPVGVELSSWGTKHAKEHFNLPILQGTLKDAAFPDQHFDAIVMTDVIERLENPMEALEEIRRILKNDGILYLSTPDVRSFISRMLGAMGWGIHKFHLYYFTRETLKQYFDVVGFKKIRDLAYPRIFSLHYWAKRLQPYPLFVHGPVDFLSRIANWGKVPLKIVLQDQIGVILKKISRLDSLEMAPQAPLSHRQRQKVVAVLPAYNAAKTLGRTVADIPKDFVDEIILVDDASADDTVKIAKKLGLTVFCHKKNRGYGGNQKTCYENALKQGADIAVMVHPDYQYDPRIIPQLIEPILKGQADAVFGSRMIKGGALEGGMPLWKYNANILLTALENVILGTYLTEYHSGFRAYSAKALRKIRYQENSDNFVFDTEIIVQLIHHRFRIEEIPIRTRYFEEASSIRLLPSILYGLGILRVMAAYVLHKSGIFKWRLLEPVSETSVLTHLFP